MSDFQFSAQAERDISGIWRYIARDNISEADKLISDLLRACTFLSENPYSGSLKNHLTKRDVRFWNVRANYWIVYEPDRKPLLVVRVLHAARNMGNLL